MHTTAARLSLLSVTTAIGIVLSVAKPVAASCVAPEPEVVWSYPADGAQDVPTDATFWFAFSLGYQPQMMLNGKPLGEPTLVSYGTEYVDPGPLEADTDYVLGLVQPRRPGIEDAGPPDIMEIAFHTGSGKAVQLPAPVVSGHQPVVGIDPMHSCIDVINTQDCFDTGQDTLIDFDVTPNADAIAWLVQYGLQGTVWPNDCGKPAVFLSIQGAAICFDIQAIGPGGKLSDKTQHCVEGAPPVFADAGAHVADAGPRIDQPKVDASIQADAAVVHEAVSPPPQSTDPTPTPAIDSGVPTAHPEPDGCSVADVTTAPARSAPWALFTLVALALRAQRRRR